MERILLLVCVFIDQIWITLVGIKTDFVHSDKSQSKVVYIHTTFRTFLIHTQPQRTCSFAIIRYIHIYCYSMIRLFRFECISLCKEISCCNVAAEILLKIILIPTFRIFKSTLKNCYIFFKSFLVFCIKNRYQCFFSICKQICI